MQSALLDEHTRNIAYDEKRGEPRGPVSAEGAGDCIDCDRCVQVCPTGIDIRQGIQLECIACANCIDACDRIMDKLDRPRGLIRYASEEELEGRPTRWLRPRTILYAVLLMVGLGVAIGALQTVQPLSANVTRMSGSPFFMTEDSIRNQFQIRISNKSNEAQHITLDASVPDGIIIEKATLVDWQLDPMEERIFTWVINTPRAGFGGSFPVDIRLEALPGGWAIERSMSFVGPDPKLLQQP
jgi:cytochrome c oxidase accessory protein FixG